MEDYDDDDDFPVMTPIDSLPSPSAEQLALWFPPKSEAICAAEGECKVVASVQAPLLIDELIKEGTPVHKLQDCLLYALQSSNVSLSQKLLDLGVPFNENMIRAAIQQKSTDSLALFLSHGWDINRNLEWCYPGPLSLAVDREAQTGDAVVRWFLSQGADPDKMCEMDITPLSIAVQEAPFWCIEILLDHVPHPRHGQLLHHAARRKSDDCAKVMSILLERYDSNVNKIMYEDHIFSFYIRKCVGLGTPLHNAARFGRPETIRVLLDHGANSNALDSNGDTALTEAIEAENHAVIELLRSTQAPTAFGTMCERD